MESPLIREKTDRHLPTGASGGLHGDRAELIVPRLQGREGVDSNLGIFQIQDSSILAWKIPWTEEHDGLQSMQCKRVRHD